jgi:glutamate N-acetyltransferase / amino-acid N-acetyltransferase
MKLDIYFNDEPLCLAGAANGDRHRVDLSDKYINIRIDLNLGQNTVNMITTDLSTEYVIENSEYSS